MFFVIIAQNNIVLGSLLTVHPLVINCIVFFEWVIPMLFFPQKMAWITTLMHSFLINIKGGTHDHDLELHSTEMCPDIKHFLLVKVSSQAVCSTMQYVKSLHFCLWRQKCNCKQRHDCFSQPGFPYWNWRNKVKRDYKNVWVSWRFDVMWHFQAYLPQIPVDWPAVTVGNLLISCFCPWNCIWVEDKPLRGVCKAMMFVDRAVGNCWLNHFLCIKFWKGVVFIYSRHTQTVVTT